MLIWACKFWSAERRCQASSGMWSTWITLRPPCTDNVKLQCVIPTHLHGMLSSEDASQIRFLRTGLRIWGVDRFFFWEWLWEAAPPTSQARSQMQDIWTPTTPNYAPKGKFGSGVLYETKRITHTVLKLFLCASPWLVISEFVAPQHCYELWWPYCNGRLRLYQWWRSTSWERRARPDFVMHATFFFKRRGHSALYCCSSPCCALVLLSDKSISCILRSPDIVNTSSALSASIPDHSIKHQPKLVRVSGLHSWAPLRRQEPFGITMSGSQIIR